MQDPSEGEEKLQCPYNSSHYILKKRMATHLIKCAKNYPDSRLIQCDFNSTHRIPEPEKQYHHQNCPDRIKMELPVFQEAGTDINRFPINNVYVPTEESWDSYNTPTYDAKKKAEMSGVIRHLDVASAGARRDFRLTERRRIGQMASSDARDSSESIARQNRSNPGPSKRVLPETRENVMTERTPASITDILERVQHGAGKSYLPKLPPK